MTVILASIVINSTTNESETNSNTHSLPSLTGITLIYCFPYNYSSNSLPNCLRYKEAFRLNAAASVKQMRLDFDYAIHSSA